MDNSTLFLCDGSYKVEHLALSTKTRLDLREVTALLLLDIRIFNWLRGRFEVRFEFFANNTIIDNALEEELLASLPRGNMNPITYVDQFTLLYKYLTLELPFTVNHHTAFSIYLSIHFIFFIHSCISISFLASIIH